MTPAQRKAAPPPRPAHIFEAAGLGRAPFRVVGHDRLVCAAAAGGPARPGGSCDYCGTAIVDAYLISSADGARFKVGSDCVEKTGDRGMRLAVRRLARERDATRADERIEAARARIQEVAGTLRSQPHPRAWAAARGLTRLDWAEWMLENAGRAGRLQAARWIETCGRGASYAVGRGRP